MTEGEPAVEETGAVQVAAPRGVVIEFLREPENFTDVTPAMRAVTVLERDEQERVTFEYEVSLLEGIVPESVSIEERATGDGVGASLVGWLDGALQMGGEIETVEWSPPERWVVEHDAGLEERFTASFEPVEGGTRFEWGYEVYAPAYVPDALLGVFVSFFGGDVEGVVEAIADTIERNAAEAI